MLRMSDLFTSRERSGDREFQKEAAKLFLSAVMGVIPGPVGYISTAASVVKSLAALAAKHEHEITDDDLRTILLISPTDFNLAVDRALRNREIVPSSPQGVAMKRRVQEHLRDLSDGLLLTFRPLAALPGPHGPRVLGGNPGLDGLSGIGLEAGYMYEFTLGEYRKVASHYRQHFGLAVSPQVEPTFYVHLMGAEASFRLVSRRNITCDSAIQSARAMADPANFEQQHQLDRVNSLINNF
jgi:hypothetical protein